MKRLVSTLLGIVPKFREVFDSMDITLPVLTSTILNIADWMKNNIMIMMGITVVLVIALKIYRSSKTGKSFSGLSKS